MLDQANLYSKDLWKCIEYNGETYFVEFKENGKVLNKYQICVGRVINNNKIEFNDELIQKLNETHMDDYNTDILLDPKNHILMNEYIRYNIHQVNI